jgi:hypothetical protein
MGDDVVQEKFHYLKNTKRTSSFERHFVDEGSSRWKVFARNVEVLLIFFMYSSISLTPELAVIVANYTDIDRLNNIIRSAGLICKIATFYKPEYFKNYGAPVIINL